MRLTAPAFFALVLVGCVADVDDLGASSAAMVITESCEISGLASLEDHDFVMGRARGGDTGADGHWLHVAPDPAVVCGEPDWILCRINGATLGDFGGPARLGGQPGYEFRVHVQDRSKPGPRQFTPGVPEVRTLAATRTYRPSRWDDGVLEIADAARVTIPAELPVVVGGSGNQWATITFERADVDDVAVCRYRGDGRNGNSGGTSYEFVRCSGLRRDTPPIAPGSEIDVRSLELHVQDGAQHEPNRRDPRTVVSVDLAVTPLTEVLRTPDFYRIVVWNQATGEQVLMREGDVVHGDLQITQLDP